MPKRLLIVDDSEDLQMLLQRVFETKGYEVVKALNGKEALKILFSTDSLPDLIILDLMLPDMNGEDFAKIKEKSAKIKNIPVVLMSAGVTHLSEVDPRLNIKGQLAKPLDLNHLLATIESALT